MVSQIFYYNSDKFPAIAQEYSDVKSRTEKNTAPKKTQDTSIFTSFLEVTPQGRRLVSAPDKAEKGDYASVAGAVGLTLINIKEDCRDIRGAINQIKGLPAKYDYKNYQHGFSFTRGTTIENWLNRKADEGKTWAKWIEKQDKTLADTNFGRKLLNFTKAEEKDVIETPIENARGYKIPATSYEGSLFGELTGRAMKRTTKLGLIVMAAVEIPKILKSMTTDGSICDRTASTLKQTTKSAINIASCTAGIAYGGAIGAKYFGAVGSLVGMGFGAIVGNKLSEKAQQII